MILIANGPWFSIYMHLWKKASTLSSCFGIFPSHIIPITILYIKGAIKCFFWRSLWFRDTPGDNGYCHTHHGILLPFLLLAPFPRESQIYSISAELWSCWFKSWWLIYSWVLGPLAVIYPGIPKFSLLGTHFLIFR